jgi:type I restriction enzyme S subunit
VRKDIRERIDRIRRGEVPEGYKKTKLGIIPEKWELESFSDIVVIEGGLVDPKIEPYASMYHIGSENIEKNTGRIRDVKRAVEQGLISGKYEFDENSIIYSKIRPKLNKVCIPNYKGICSADCYVIKVKEKILKKYLYNYMLSEYFYKQAQACSMRTKMPKINRKELGTFKIIIPEIEEQEKINTFLEMYDRIIDLQGEKLENVRKKKKWLVQNLLTGKKRLAGFHSLWKKVFIKDVVLEGSKEKVDNIKSYRKITIKLNFGGIEFLNTYRKMADTRPFYVRKKGEIIVGKQNYFHGSIAIVDEEFDGTICSNAIMSFLVKENCCDKYFLLYYLSQTDYINKKSFLANGTGQKELSENDFLNFDIRLPELEEQKAIAQVLATADREIELLKKQLEQIKREKKAMMQLLLTGIVRVDEK